MDTTAPKPDQNGVQQGQNAPVSAPSGVSAQQPSQVAPQGSVNTQSGKEYEPGQSLHEYGSLPGHEQQPVLSPELQNAGLETVADHEHPRLTLEDKRVGISHGPDATSLATPVNNNMPMTHQKAEAVLESKEYKIWDSIKWYAKNIFRQEAKKGINQS